MTTIAATAADHGALEAGLRVVARRRRVATAVASVFFAIGWITAWLAPPALVALARRGRAGAGWCASACAVGWADARAAAAATTRGGNG